MALQPQCGEGAREPVADVRLELLGGDVITGTVAAGDGSGRPFHGWLELMDALEAIRTNQGEPEEEI
jgi:hypothetical protein